MGEIRHRVVNAHPELELKVICETDPTKLTANQPFQVVREPEEVLKSDVDLIFVCTPNNHIPALSIEAMKLGKHVFAEKPPGRCLQDIEFMRQQEELSPKCKLMFGFNHRYHPGILKAKDLISTGRFGKTLWVRGIYGKSGGKNFRGSWRNNKDISGGGILLDQGIHMLDLFNYFCDDFEEVKCFASNKYWGFDLEDNAFVILNNKNGQSGMLHSSATLWKHKFKLEIGLEKGYMNIEGLLSKTASYGRETLTVGRQQFEDEAYAVGNPSEEITYFDRDLSWEIEVQNIVDCIKNNTPVMESSSVDAFKAMNIVEKAYKDSGLITEGEK
ncbi:MAG: Gfo/Idh/MocA family oxidoreductase [Bdellovibrionales bacterium]|nr:Gfo/Idh/MocA family oxidoreductase [Bdellovibrionales bacterium]